jgi:hypothetical protein
MRILTTLLVTYSVCSSVLSTGAALTINSLGTAFTEDFDTLANSTASATLPTGWYLSESGGNADPTYTAGTGSGNAGDTYSFGSAASTDRALGGLQSGSLIPTFGAQLQNNTGTTITSLLIAYVGEMWRLGTSDRGADRLDFQYSLDATSLTTGTWTDVDTLDFSTPNLTGTAGLRDGNAAGNKTLLSDSLSVSLLNGGILWLRWNDFNASGADDGLAVDDFSITAASTIAVVPEPSTFIAGALLALPFGAHGIRFLRQRKRA